METAIEIGHSQDNHPARLFLKMANRHGLIAGATGTGKTVTLQNIAERFSNDGIPIFTADVKGDIAGLARYMPVTFWDIYGKQGIPLRTTISELGPLLLGRLLGLNETQQSVLNVAFSLADDQQLLLLDLKDIRSLLDWMSQHSSELKNKYGNLPASSLTTIQRELVNLEQAGGNDFFGEPAFEINNLLELDKNGHGVINILDATNLIHDSRMYSTFLLWMLSQLFEVLPEVGDIDKPKLVFFFDEAHLFFNTASTPLVEKIEQLVRLIRSKGVGVYFITQNPTDIPDSVLGQLGNRVQHALRAYTPKDQKTIKATAEGFRTNPKLDTVKEITQLGVGEALISFLDEKGIPGIVEKVKIDAPTTKLSVFESEERNTFIHQSKFYDKYAKAIERESAFEKLAERNQTIQPTANEVPVPTSSEPKRSPGRPRQTATETFIKSTARSVGSQLGRQIIRGILGSIFRKK